MASGGGGFVCPLCAASVESADALQLHYLTSCSGYDKGPGDERGVASAAAPPTNETDDRCQVQFMWQPLTEMKYSKVTLLASFETGSIDLTLDPEGGHYYSPQISILRGTYEGQLVVGDAFIHPVKEFTVENDEGIVVLEFDLKAAKSEDHGRGVGEGDLTTQYGTGYMQQNPSYNYQGGGGYYYDQGPALDAYEGRSYEQGRRKKTGTSSEGEGLQPTRDFEYHDQYPADYELQPRAPPSNEPTLPHDSQFTQPAVSQATTDPPLSPHSEHFSRQLSSEGFDPAAVKPKEGKLLYMPDNSRTPGTTFSGGQFVSGRVGGAGGGAGGGDFHPAGVNIQSKTDINITPTSFEPRILPKTTVAASTVGGTGHYAMKRLDSGEDEGERERWRTVPLGGRDGYRAGMKWRQDGEEIGGVGEWGGGGVREGGEGELVKAKERHSSLHSRQRDGFSVDSIHHHRSKEDMARDYEQQLAELRQQLEAVTKERDSVLESRERVTAHWEGKIRRLERQLRQHTGEEGAAEVPEDTGLESEEATRSQVAVLNAQIESLTVKVEGKDRELVDLERQLQELKDRNTALENQLSEYMAAMQEQSKSLQHAMANRQANSADLLKAEQESQQMAQYMKQQQLEYQEALQSLQKKVGLVDEVQKENLKIHQLNVTLTGELEDYRHQTKSLIADLNQKDEEIARLQEARSHSLSSDRAQLELESMKQKCDAWREEVEKLAPLKDEVARLREENTMLYQKAAQATEDATGLGKQLQGLSVSRGRQGELERKAAEYDQMMERVTELQQVRAQLENELVPLREERATILTENAQLREGSQPEKYTQLLSNYNALSTHCVQLQKSLTEESAVSKRMEEANRELQQQLHEATNEKNLQTIRERMERYRQERDQAKTQLAELQVEVQTYQEEAVESQETIAGLQKALDESSSYQDQEQADMWQQEIDTLSHKVEEYEKRMKRYREERNTAQIIQSALEQQVATLQSTVEELQNSRAYSSYDTGQFDSVTGSASVGGGLQVSSSPPDDQRDVYSADRYSETSPSVSSEGRHSESRKLFQESSAATTPSGGGYKPRIGSGSSKSGGIVVVKMKDGTTRDMVIHRPMKKLNPKLKPAVIVKRSAGKYETGILMYVGPIDGKEMAGVKLDLPRTEGSPPNDGTFRDGKTYFRCTPGYGLYCPFSNIYIEAESTNV